MKRILSVVLAVLMLVAFVGCGEKETETLKFGMGSYVYYKTATSADGETNGKGQAVANVAAVLLDGEGKIVKCAIDTADNTVQYTSEGKAVAGGDFLTKYELGDAYNMVAYGGSTLEWYAQADAFEKVVEGKTIEEVKALVAEGNKGTEEVIGAGCTIMINEFVLAIENAVANAADSAATAQSTLNIGVNTVLSTKDASEDANGESKLEINFVAVALDENGKVLAADTDVVDAKFGFDAKGAATTDAASELKTKKTLGDAYNMVAYGGSTLEWYAQADVLDAQVVGKTANEIAALALDTGYGVESLTNANCTISVGGIVKAAVKAATID